MKLRALVTVRFAAICHIKRFRTKKPDFTTLVQRTIVRTAYQRAGRVGCAPRPWCRGFATALDIVGKCFLRWSGHSRRNGSNELACELVRSQSQIDSACMVSHDRTQFVPPRAGPQTQRFQHFAQCALRAGQKQNPGNARLPH